MRVSIIRPFLVLVLLSSIGFAKPTINADGVVSAATYLASGFPNSGIAQGSIFLVFGSGLGPAAVKQASTFPLPTTAGLAGTSIKVTVGSTSKDAIMLYTVAGQVAAVLPSSTPVGVGTLVLTYNGAASDPAPIHVVKSSFGAFTLNQGGSGTAVITTPAFAVVTLLASSKPGDVITLWGTGLGPVTGDEAGGPLPGDLKSLNVKVWVGGAPAQVLYRGRSGCCTGLDQVAIKIPNGVQGCFVPVAVQVGGVISNFPSIPISPNGNTCSDPAGLSAAMLQQAANGQNIKVGTILLSRFTSNFKNTPIGDLVVSQDAGSAFFYSFTPSQLIASRGITALNAFGSCVVWQCRGAACVPDSQALNLTRLDAGSAITVTGPNGPKPLTKTSTGAYTASLGGGLNDPNYLDPGSYAVTGPGGSAVKAFTANLSISASPIDFQAQQNGQDLSGTISRAQDVNITWHGGGSSGYAVIVGTSTSDATSDAPQVTATFSCTEKNSVGHFTVPSWVLSALPASGTLSQGGLSVSNGFLLMGSYPDFATFPATGLDYGFATSLVISGNNDQYQ